MNASAEPTADQTSTAGKEAPVARRVLRHPEVIVTLAVIILMVGLVPYALSFKVYDRIYSDGVYKASHTEDPHYAERGGLITVGLVLPFVSLGCLALSLVRPGNSGRTVLMLTAALYTFVVGWCCYPYWANGVHQATADFVSRSGLDPKPLLPMVWVGEAWWLPAVLLPPFAVVATIALSVATYRVARKQGEAGLWLHTVVALLVLMFLAAAFTPNYMVWILD